MLYVDLDGVLANLNKAGANLFGLTYPKRQKLCHNWLQVETGMGLDDWMEKIQSDPGVWERIEPFPWTAQLVQCLDVHAPGWKILSVAIHDPACWSGKAKWVREKLFPVASMHRLVLVGGRKFDLASRNDILIDDWQENVDQWRRSGGAAFKWEEFTEDMHDAAMDQIQQLREFLQQHQFRLRC